MEHPSERDLINYAREELGRYKKFRIIEHCKECPECADRLIEAAREHGPEPEPFKLSKWNKISIVVMLGALLAVAFGMWWLLRSVGQGSGIYEPPAAGAPVAPEDEIPQEGAPPDETEAQRLG
ncbi:MAG: hypothetical protein GKS06_03495 [Acidobacteria bacterium]|nr:hypothetical protein [Acidobacteriota bacterium]